MGRTAPSPGLEPGLLVEVPERHPPGRDVRIEAHVRIEAVAVGPRDAIPAAELALVIAVDVAASRRAAAVAALAEAVGALPDGISYTVLDGEASRCYPLHGRWAVADTDDRRRAAFSVGRIAAAPAVRRPAGYARWLAGARELFADSALPVRHLVLITDGSGRGEDGDDYREDSALRTELARCGGEFTADVLAVGESWDPAPLIAVAERLHGDAAYAPDAFAPAIAAAVGRLRRIRSPALALTVTVRPAVREVTLTETAPRQQRLDPAGDGDDPRRLEFLTRQWKPETRDYLLSLRVDAGNDPLGVPLQLATVTVGDLTEPVVIRWLPAGAAAATADHSGGADRSVHAMNASTEIRTALRRAYDALDRERHGEAEKQFGRAVRLAAGIGATWVPAEVRNVAEIVDEREGRVRIGPTVDRGTVRRGRLSIASAHRVEPPEGPAGPTARCPGCEHPAGHAARFCIACGRRL
ncbi:hypothetical protein ACIOHO_00875 [Streptomyces sp. NPDC087849]|uniref:hypothetical protein n=1 Tax=Streptomyces sp. NPDC087849 TaxID=3365808 RepID=UPI0037F93481